MLSLRQTSLLPFPRLFWFGMHRHVKQIGLLGIFRNAVLRFTQSILNDDGQVEHVGLSVIWIDLFIFLSKNLVFVLGPVFGGKRGFVNVHFGTWLSLYIL